MKDFFKMFFACVLAMFVAAGAMMLFTLVIFGALAAAGDEKPEVQKDSVLVVDLSANIADSPASGSGEEFISGILGGDGPKRLQLRKVVGAIEAAAGDDRIKAIFMHGSFEPSNYGSGYAALLEVRAALERFRAKDKPVVAYLVTPTTRDYLVASTASRIVLNPMGMMMTHGLAAEVPYFGGLFEKYGIGVQVAKTGKYKSAAETFSQDHMSDAEREQLTRLLDDMWKAFVVEVSRSRKLDDGVFQNIVDTEGLVGPEAAVKAGLVDELGDFPQMLDELKKLTGETKPGKSFRQIDLSAYIAAREPAPSSTAKGGRIAVVYAEGEIVDGEGSPQNVGGDKLARELRKIRTDDEVKAVVLRVNSPGGSAIASEVIRRELVLLHEKKPLVVSMGTVAASGGYWISTACDRIFAQRNTITGSIGVVAMVPNIKGLAERFSVNIESVKTGRFADIFSIATPRDAAAMAVLQKLVDETYTKFLDRVTESRKMERSAIEAIASGHVWSGADALQNGLVDEVGGLEDAIKHAASLAKLEEYSVVDRPASKSFFEELMQRLENKGTPLASRSGPAGEIRRQIGQSVRMLESLNDPSGIYAIMPMIVDIK